MWEDGHKPFRRVRGPPHTIARFVDNWVQTLVGVLSVHSILYGQLNSQIKINGEGVDANEKTGLDTLKRREGNDIWDKFARLLVKHDADCILGEWAGGSSLGLVAAVFCERVEVGVLCANGKDDEDNAYCADVASCEGGGVLVRNLKLLQKPAFFDVEVICLGVLEEGLHQEVGDITRREGANRRYHSRGRLQLLRAVVLLEIGDFAVLLKGIKSKKEAKTRRSRRGSGFIRCGAQGCIALSTP
ncbi:unnamed protein product [Clonostachys rosea f. rosea IK726]|uniref:Uncharacterized protein n=1 Tax=Clonostachys rosea f. rosea IK726 TaxID=1349383 RepID=A0ACA9TKC2_BIOOC|nr:unnamed protein product [Clonostachys rosea f. rosea IK726]